MKYTAAILAVALLLLAAGTADAASIVAAYEGVSGYGAKFSTDGGSNFYTTTSGRFSYDRNSTHVNDDWTEEPIYHNIGAEKFYSFCIELNQNTTGGDQTYLIEDLADVARIKDQTNAANHIAILWEEKYSMAMSQLDRAIFQACVWEIVYEDYATNGYGLGAGTFQLTSTTTGLVSGANTWLAALAKGDYGTDAATLKAMTNTSYQDQIFEVAGDGDNVVPLPSSALAGMAFLGMLAVVRIRRKRHL